MRSRYVISCHMTATSCQFQPCRSSNVHKTRRMRLLQPLPGDIRWNDVASGSLPVTWGHVTSFPVTWLPPPASYSPVKSTVPKTRLLRILQPLFRWLPVKWRHVRDTYGHARSCDVISCHVTATSCEFHPCKSSKSKNSTYTPSTGTSSWLPVKWRHFWVTSGYVMSRDGHLLRVSAL